MGKSAARLPDGQNTIKTYAHTRLVTEADIFFAVGISKGNVVRMAIDNHGGSEKGAGTALDATSDGR
jgi:hypothetical protein